MGVRVAAYKNLFRNTNHNLTNGKWTCLTKGKYLIQSNIYVEEKPTGEIAAGAGYGTEGSTIFFSVSDNVLNFY